MQSVSSCHGPDVSGDELMDSLELGFDFSSDLFDFGESKVAVEKDIFEEPGESQQKPRAVKAVKSSSGSATVISKVKVAKSQPFKGTKWLENAERKATMLYAFPSFDRSDSLIFLPTSLCRLMNSGDMTALSKLISSHFAKTCEIKMSSWDGPSVDVKFLLKMYKMLLDIHPDSIQVAHNTKVDGNKITASIFTKHTNCCAIHGAVSRTTKDTFLSTTLTRGREEHMQRVLQDDPRPPEELQRFQQLAASKDDLVLYLQLEVEYTVDDLTKKVSQFSMNGKITSMELAKKNASSNSITYGS